MEVTKAGDDCDLFLKELKSVVIEITAEVLMSAPHEKRFNFSCNCYNAKSTFEAETTLQLFTEPS